MQSRVALRTREWPQINPNALREAIDSRVFVRLVECRLDRNWLETVLGTRPTTAGRLLLSEGFRMPKREQPLIRQLPR